MPADVRQPLARYGKKARPAAAARAQHEMEPLDAVDRLRVVLLDAR
jgi:hypothetical protein